jgi:hypothetical protein
VLPRENSQRDRVLAAGNLSSTVPVLAGQPYPLAPARLCIASPRPRGQHNCPQHVGLDELSVVEQTNLHGTQVFRSTGTTLSQTKLGRIKTLNWKEDIAMLQLSL